MTSPYAMPGCDNCHESGVTRGFGGGPCPCLVSCLIPTESTRVHVWNSPDIVPDEDAPPCGSEYADGCGTTGRALHGDGLCDECHYAKR